MIAWALAGLALGTVQSNRDEFAQNTRCIPAFTLMGWETDRLRPSARPAPQPDAPPSAGRPRRDEQPEQRPCLHLANG